MRPVPHSDILPVSQPPENVIFSDDELDRREQQSDDTNFEADAFYPSFPRRYDDFDLTSGTTARYLYRDNWWRSWNIPSTPKPLEEAEVYKD
ncbi:hypothetical protein LAZ67_5001353 [Cordylochernes scorpioides]|uniref:Uncharacterized protein n=1 Tax=Cordylochernes scorpioides TaxID=51811 RepID=A0ABY6KKB2_9ARAC|nr:hypothetical protein LAZ67_5001353 [Cordylochernes scorpioides]